MTYSAPQLFLRPGSLRDPETAKLETTPSLDPKINAGYMFLYIPGTVPTLLLLVVRPKTWLFCRRPNFLGRGPFASVFPKGLGLDLGAWDFEAQIPLGSMFCNLNPD